MRIFPLVRALLRQRTAWLLGSAATVAIPIACSEDSAGKDQTSEISARPSAPITASADTRARLQAIRTRFPGTLLSTDREAPLFEAAPSGGIRPILPPHAGPKTSTVELPLRSSDPVRLSDNASQLSVSFALDGAAPAELTASDGIAVYAGAAPGGGDILHRVSPTGTEDFVLFVTEPEHKELRYEVDVGAVAGLRLVANTLEFLDASGAPRLRVAPPYVLGADGARLSATLTVENCAVDRSPRAPWGRPVVNPGASSCAVKVAFPDAGIRYPALVDPVWQATTNTMSTARTRHTITLLDANDPKGLALITGGFAVANGAPLKSAELYDPLSRRFSATANMNVARGAHTAALLTPLGPAPVLIAGGRDASSTPLGSLEVYDPASGVFVLDANTMPNPRFDHTATLFADNQVLLAGGISLPLNQPTNTSHVYTFTAFLAGTPPAGVTSSLVNVADPMESSRTNHAALLLKTGDVLLTGGFVLAGGALQALQTAELWSPTTLLFGPITTAGGGLPNMSFQRGSHTATLLASGQVLIAGGLSKTVGGIFTNTIDLYADGSKGPDKGFLKQPIPITMSTGRANHTATRLPTGDVLIAGGFNGVSALANEEIFSVQGQSFSALEALVPMATRGDHAAILINAGDSLNAGHTVLITGGSTSSTPGATALASAQILLRVTSEPCVDDDECHSGFCTDGVCCNARCNEECFACSKATNASGVDGVCGFAAKGSDPRVQCINEVEVHTQCDGAGSTEQTDKTKDCKPGTCGADGTCAKDCVSSLNCSKTGWCDLSSGVGQCRDKSIISTGCTADEQCESNFCVDGFCCELACAGQCQACDVPGFPGKCLPVGSITSHEDAHPNQGGTSPRKACDGFVNGVKTGCTGYCDGTKANQCAYPLQTSELQDPICADKEGGPSLLTNFPCMGDGKALEQPSDCKGFKCADEKACKTSCADDADCITDHVCVPDADDAKTKSCKHLDTPLCDGDHTLRKPVAEGGNTTCSDHFTCPKGATACRTDCDSVTDCVDNFVCNGARKCVEQLDPPPVPSCSCRAVGEGADDAPTAPLALALGALALGAASRRRRRA